MGKTGTSSIQYNLLNNVEALEKLGIYFPVINDDPRPFNGNHSIVMTSLFSDRALSLADNIKVGFNTEEKLHDSNQRVLKNIYEGFTETSAEKLLISAEAATHFDNKTISKMSIWLQEYCEKLMIIACLRHPEDALASEIQQQIKIGKTLEELYLEPPISPISGCLQRHFNFYGNNSLHVYDFTSALENEYGITGEFLKQINLSTEHFSIKNEFKNQSLSQEAVVLLSTLNRLRPLKVGNKLGAKRFLQDRELFFSLQGQKYRVPKEVLIQSKQQIEQEVQWVQDRFGLRLKKLSENSYTNENHFSKESLESLVIAISDLQNKIINC